MKKHSEWLLEINSSLKKCYGLIENPENHPKWSPYKINVKTIDKSHKKYRCENCNNSHFHKSPINSVILLHLNT